MKKHETNEQQIFYQRVAKIIYSTYPSLKVEKGRTEKRKLNHKADPNSPNKLINKRTRNHKIA